MWLMWGARLSDSTDVPMHTPWKNLWTLEGTPYPADLQNLASKTAWKHQQCNHFCHTQILHSSVLGQQQVEIGKRHFKTKSPRVSAGHTKSIFTISSPFKCHSHSSILEVNRLGWWGWHEDKQKCMNRKQKFQLLRCSITATLRSVIILYWC